MSNGSFPTKIGPRTTAGAAGGAATAAASAAPPRAIDRYDNGRAAAASAASGSLMKPPGSLDPSSRSALEEYQKGTYGQTGKDLSPKLAGKTAA